ncbi:MAG: hypothetical protein P8N43_08710, partial [Alphaproteobacteria bacterium]|nr:hypothetical protein [Alphaproteobacteria bacterium]
TPNGPDLRAAAFGDGVFLAGGGNGSLLKLNDENSWDSVNAGIKGVIQGLAHNGSRKFIAVTGNKDGSSSGAIFVSSDSGNTWGESQDPQLNYLGVATAGGGSYVAVSQNGKIVANDNGILNNENDNELRAVGFGNNKYLAVGKKGTIIEIKEADDTFTTKTIGQTKLKVSNFNGVTYGEGVWVVAGTLGSLFISGDNGTTWRPAKENPFLAEEDITSLSYRNGLFVAGGTNGKTAVSVDGLSWYQEDVAFPVMADGQKGNYNVNALAIGDDNTVIGVSSSSKIASATPTVDSPTEITNLLGTTGDDTLNGAEGNNLLKGYTGNDSLTGSNGRDTIEGNQGDDTLIGNGKNDEIYGGDGKDELTGNAGDDTLNGGKGDDTLSGNEGADLFSLATNNENDLIKDFKDEDRLMTPPLQSKINIGLGSINSESNTADIIITLTDANQQTSTTTLETVGFDDLPNEGAARKYIFEKLGIPILQNEDGIVSETDNLTFNSVVGGKDNYSKGVLISPLTLAMALGEGEGQTEEDIEKIPLTINAGGGADAVRGGLKNDSISASEGDDTVYGGKGADTILGGNGNDEIDGGDGQDLLEGGEGSDKYVLSKSGDGKDTILGYSSDDSIVLPGVTKKIDVDGNVEIGLKDAYDEEGNSIDKTNREDLENAKASYLLTYNITGNSLKAKNTGAAGGQTLVITEGSFLPTAEVAISSVNNKIENPIISGTNGQLRTGEKVQISSNDGKPADVVQETTTTWSFI